MDGEDLRLALAAHGFRDVSVARSQPAWGAARGIEVGVEATKAIAGELVRLGVGLSTDFPDVLPEVFGLSVNVRKLPHVDGNGFVCAATEEGTLHDHRRTESLISEVIARAEAIIEDGLLGRSKLDFLEEAEAYWEGRGAAAACVVDADDVPRLISGFWSGANELIFVADSVDSLREMLPGAGGRALEAIYLPLDRGRTLPAHPSLLATWSPYLFDQLTDAALKFLHARRVTKRQGLLVVLGIPRSGGTRALIGLQLEKLRPAGTLHQARPESIRPVELKRYDDERLNERAPPKRARVGIVGCGAIGGHVAHVLAWSVASELVLIDDDGYHGGNALRHVLGRSGWSAPSKVEGLRRQLLDAVPRLKVTAIKDTIGSALPGKMDLLRGLDVIVVAIGTPSVPLRLNDDFIAQRFPVPVVYTWLEPYGLGGHALLVRAGTPGCLRCLFEDSPELRNTADFAAPGQRFAQRQLGCHGEFTPYGDTDARETALTAARLVERILRDKGVAPWTRSWRGDAGPFRAAGFRTSERFDQAPALIDERLPPRRDCPTCGT